MNAKSAAIALLALASITGPALADDHFTSRSANDQVALANPDAGGAPANGLYKAPYGVSNLMCSPSGFGHVSTCVTKTFANRHQLVEISSR